MLADRLSSHRPLGNLDPVQKVFLWNSFFNQFYEFLGKQISIWSADSQKLYKTAENALTQQLCSHLNFASYHTPGWDILRFNIEVIDEIHPGRRIDLAAFPCAYKIEVQGRCYTHYDMIIPIECKRLPTPKSTGRDEREYVFDGHSTLGGIQRFKLGLHGKIHAYGAMIAYVQSDKCCNWFPKVNKWIEELAATGQKGWSKSDVLKGITASVSNGMEAYDSTHQREGSIEPINIRHFWIEIPKK